MKRFFSLLMGILLVFSTLLTLAACAETEGNSKVTGELTGEVDSDAKFADLDFGNEVITFIVAEGNNGRFSERSITVDSASGDGVDSKIYSRNEIVSSMLKVQIDLVDVLAHNKFSDTIKPTLQAGGDDYDIIGGYQAYDAGLAADNLLLNINDLAKYDADYIDITQPYWSQYYCEQLSYGNALYWLTGDLSLRYLGGMYCTFVNGDLYEKYLFNEFGSIYEIVKNGDWTLSKLMEMGDYVFIDDGEIADKPDAEDTLGFCIELQDPIDGMAIGYGIKWSQKDADGKVTITLNSDKSVSFGQQMEELLAARYTYVAASSDSVNTMNTFAAGKQLFACNKVYQAEVFLREMNNYYIIPIPKAEAGKDTSYTTAIHDGVSIYGITSGSSHIAAAAATLELMAKKSYELVTPEYYEMALKYKYARDDDSAAMIDTIREGVYTDFAFAWGGSINSIHCFFRTNCNSNVQSSLKSNTKSWNKLLGKLITKFENNTAEE